MLKIKNLRTSFKIDGKFYAAADGISFDVGKNEILAIVGESGSGKSAAALSITRLHNKKSTRIEGEIIFNGTDLLSVSEKELLKIRGKHIGMIFQDPLTALNPLMRIGAQIEEPLIYHTNFNSEERKSRVLELLEAVGMTPRAYKQFPHELSGGMRQRAMIAVALSCDPALVIADEPTTALDVTIQAQILELLSELQKKMQTSIILITHDLGVVSEIADKVAVMYAGQIVETATVDRLFTNPRHPYTRALLAAIPSMSSNERRFFTIPGAVPTLREMPRTGCRFSRRMPHEARHETEPTFHEVEPDHQVLCICHS
ncbi:MAG: ABC transporter ATP-binding protein [Clostridiales bacterium]|jgi:peptide/nickel transport system ATP-binding protein|nr:ABC transporter ATP-binding protein [Clostridiales bacterium]